MYYHIASGKRSDISLLISLEYGKRPHISRSRFVRPSLFGQNFLCFVFVPQNKTTVLSEQRKFCPKRDGLTNLELREHRKLKQYNSVDWERLGAEVLPLGR